MTGISRRDFLRTGGAVATATFATTPGLAFSQTVGTDAPFDDYRALVCVFLHGGNDSFNMLVPRSNAEYDVYAASRQNLAIAQDALLPIVPDTPDGVDYGLHFSMPGIRSLFESGSAALIANVGPLIEPVTQDQFFEQSAMLPPQLFSHNDQQDQWQSLRGRAQSRTGWAGRIADLIRTRVADQRLAVNASLHGNNRFQSAEESIPYIMGAGGPERFAFMSSDPDAGILYEQSQAFGRIVDAAYGSIYERGFASVQRRAIANAETVSGAIQRVRDADAVTTPFPPGQLAAQLQTVAYLIAARDELQMRRQIFFVSAGGFDSHDNQNQDQPGLLADVSESIAAFYAATEELGMAGSVTTFTQSDFGRTLTSNGDGTDHAWGGNQLVVGGGVRGREIYGTYPLLRIGGPDDVGGGRMIPTTSADQFAATLALWFGIPDTDLDIVAPHIDNFTTHDLGFMV